MRPLEAIVWDQEKVLSCFLWAGLASSPMEDSLEPWVAELAFRLVTPK